MTAQAPATTRPPGISAVLWDFGGVILESPFDAFARYEAEQGLPAGLLRTINSTNPDTNAWARLERREVSIEEFCTLYEAEAAALGHRLVGSAVLALLSGAVRAEMVEALRRCRPRFRTAMLTNNFAPMSGASDVDGRGAARRADVEAVVSLFDVVVESSKVGHRKPDPRFYEIACEMVGIEPSEAVFLDDLGINLKPAKAMGMTTIKVAEPAAALAELEAVLGIPLR